MKCVFTDCYDTLVFRREHPYQVVRRWSKCISHLYPLINADDLFLMRMKLIKQYSVDKKGIRIVYNELYKFFQQSISDKTQFLDDCLTLELQCEQSTLSINKRVDNFLRAKYKAGISVYVVSDYHLESEELFEVLKNTGVDYIKGVFSSASVGKTKREGDLYECVLKRLNVQASDCIMIGDNYKSDNQNARTLGISTRFFPNTVHKNFLRIKNKLGLQNESLYKIGNTIWRNSDSYDEYALLFYVFCVRLYNEARKRDANSIVFLAREGFYLRRCFELYQSLCVPHDERISTKYLKCSRRAIHSVQRDKCLPSFYDGISANNYLLSIGFSEAQSREMLSQLRIDNADAVINNFGDSDVAKALWDKFGGIIENRIKDNKEAFDEYVHTIQTDNKLLLVDVGWIGRMQQGIDVLFEDLSTVGFYLGIYNNLLEMPNVERHGLIFNRDEEGNDSFCFSIFRSNIQFYEQLLSAPHGSACFYYFKDQKPFVYEKWDEEEELLYREVIANEQDRIIKIVGDLCTYSFDGVSLDCYSKSVCNKSLALVMLKSSLLQSSNRLRFMKRLTMGFSQNFQQQTIGMKYDVRNINQNPLNILIHPDSFVRYVAKLGIVMDKRKMGSVGRLMMRLFYYWSRITLRFK